MAKQRKTKGQDYYPLKEGEFVYIISEQRRIPSQKTTFPGLQQSYHGRYKVGQIVQIHPGKDGVDRTYVVKHGLRQNKPYLTLMSSMCVVPVEDPVSKM